MIDFSTLSVWVNGPIFVAAAIGIWFAGAAVTTYADIIAERTGVGRVVVGALLLGVVTSLPELATTVTASVSGNATLAGTNLLGGLAMQTAVLAIVDAIALRKRALTFFAPAALLMMQGVVVVLLACLAMAAVVIGEPFTFYHIGVWPLLLAAIYLGGVYSFHRYQQDPRWEPTGEMGQAPAAAADLKDAHHQRYRRTTTSRIWLYIVLCAVAVLICGYLVATTGDILAEQTGLGDSVMGAVFVAVATSLPEISTTYTAVRFGAYSMAVADIIGTNALELALFLPADLFYREGAIFAVLEPSAIFLAALGAIMTCIYLLGMLERRNKTLWHMGYDSVAVLFVYVGGLVVYALIQ